MIGTLIFVAVGLLLIVLLILSLLWARGANHTVLASCEEDEVPAALPREASSQELTDRLFGSEDWEFIARQESAQLRRLFLRQRTTLALSWLRGEGANATNLIRIHIAAARKNSRLEPLVELRVIADYLVFQVLCGLIASVIWVRGPVAMRRLVGYTISLSERLHDVIMGVFPVELANGNGKHGPIPPGARRARGR
jgi:hypothetical protein